MAVFLVHFTITEGSVREPRRETCTQTIEVPDDALTKVAIDKAIAEAKEAVNHRYFSQHGDYVNTSKVERIC